MLQTYLKALLQGLTDNTKQWLRGNPLSTEKKELTN